MGCQVNNHSSPRAGIGFASAVIDDPRVVKQILRHLGGLAWCTR